MARYTLQLCLGLSTCRVFGQLTYLFVYRDVIFYFRVEPLQSSSFKSDCNCYMFVTAPTISKDDIAQQQ